MPDKVRFSRKTNKWDKLEVVGTEQRETIKIDIEDQTVFFKDTYVPFEKVLQVAEVIRGGLDNVEDE